MTNSYDLDLSWGAKLPIAVARDYDRVCEQCRSEFVSFIDSLSESFEGNIDWWVEGPASRNHLLSPLFHNFVSLRLLVQYIEAGFTLGTVVVDSARMRSIATRLRDDAKADFAVKYRHRIWKRSLQRIRSFLSPFRSMTRLLLEWLLIRGTGHRYGHELRERGLRYVLIDTFILPPGPRQGDRYYPGLLERLPEEVTERIRFVPQFFGFNLRELSRTAREARSASGQYLLKEDLLELGDLAWVFLHWFRIRRLSATPKYVGDVDLFPLVAEELTSNRAFRCALRGLLNYRFAKAVKEAGIAIHTVVDWFENHPMDRGWNAGFRRQYGRDARVLGYLGFFPAFQAARPTPEEYLARVIPEEFKVMGPALEADLVEFCTSLKVGAAPAFRFQWLFDEDGSQSDRALASQRRSVIIALPYDDASKDFMLELIEEMTARPSEYRLLLKQHPAKRSEADNMLDRLIGEGLEQIEGELREWFPHAFAIVCGGMSTTTLEAIARGLPVAVIARPGRHHEVSLPAFLPRSMWAICSTVTELSDSLDKFQEMASIETSPAEEGSTPDLATRMFTPVTRQSIASFLAVPMTS